mmetsp:Transcript_30829/g.78579  ORF Transcript_30829/g.78579 Transcript_30829/m.78579 type:complete len:499 (+) Transcript_30829:668-2164(+)
MFAEDDARCTQSAQHHCENGHVPWWLVAGEPLVRQHKVAAAPQTLLEEHQRGCLLDLLVLIAINGNDQVQDDDIEDEGGYHYQGAVHVHVVAIQDFDMDVVVVDLVEAQLIQPCSVTEEEAAVHVEEHLARPHVRDEYHERDEEVREDRSANEEHLLDGAAEERLEDGEDALPGPVDQPQHVDQAGHADHHVDGQQRLPGLGHAVRHMLAGGQHVPPRPHQKRSQGPQNHIDAEVFAELRRLPHEPQPRVVLPVLVPPPNVLLEAPQEVRNLADDAGQQDAPGEGAVDPALLRFSPTLHAPAHEGEQLDDAQYPSDGKVLVANVVPEPVGDGLHGQGREDTRVLRPCAHQCPAHVEIHQVRPQEHPHIDGVHVILVARNLLLLLRNQALVPADLRLLVQQACGVKLPLWADQSCRLAHIGLVASDDRLAGVADPKPVWVPQACPRRNRMLGRILNQRPRDQDVQHINCCFWHHKDEASEQGRATDHLLVVGAVSDASR